VRRGAIISLVVIGVVVGVLTTGVAVLIDWLPEQASEQREGIDFVFWLTTWICVSIFAIVASVIVYSVWKFRAPPDDDSDGPPIHGHTGIEIVWTAIPAVLVIVIGIASAIVLAQNDRSGADVLRVQVIAQQFAWRFEYANGVETETLRLPRGRDTILEISARDVIHSFWVPQFGQKQDAVPGELTKLAITPTKLGTFPVVCTELCGLGHSLMRTQVRVLERGQFDAWLRREKERLGGGGGENLGASVFQKQGCGGCHVFAPARSQGRTGPSLDELEASAREAGRPLEEYVRESIVKPDAYLHPGYADLMPKNFGELPKDQIDALVQYLVEGGAKGS
jgi:cytochrome c oxidase subunit 2